MKRPRLRRPIQRFVRRIRPTATGTAIMPLLCVLAVVLGCAGGTDIGNPEGGNFTSSAALKTYIADQYAQNTLPESMKTADMEGTGHPLMTGCLAYAPAGDASGSDSRAPGADASDKVKTDGIYLYISGSYASDISFVHIVNAGPEAGLEEAARIPVDGSIESLHLHESLLIILYTPEDGTGVSRIGILSVDVNDPQNPVIREDFQTEGSLAASWLMGGRLHVVTRFQAALPDLALWHDGTEAGKEEAVQNNLQALAALPLDELIPDYAIRNADGKVIRKGRLVDTNHFLKPETPGGGSVTAVITLDLAAPFRDFTSVGLVCDVHHVYPSGDTLYLAATRYDGTAETEAAGGLPAQTVIHRMDLSGARAVLSASGAVAGRLLPFALNEFEGILRVGTVTDQAWDGDRSHHVYCLRNEQKAFTIIGQLDGLMPGKTVYSVWFIGGRGYLAALEDTKAMQALDLSNPAEPASAGELAFSGHASSIHTLGDGRLLVTGKDAALENDTLWHQGIRMTLFAVNGGEPATLLSDQTLGDRGTESEALYNDRALTFQPERGLLVLPVTLYEHPTPPVSLSETGIPVFSGLLVYSVSPDGRLADAGRIPMSSTAVLSGEAGWMRGLFMDDRVIGVNGESVTAAGLPEIAEPFESIVLME